MAGKNKGGREARKEKADKNKKVKGQTPSPVNSAVERINHTGGSPKR